MTTVLQETQPFNEVTNMNKDSGNEESLLMSSTHSTTKPHVFLNVGKNVFYEEKDVDEAEIFSSLPESMEQAMTAEPLNDFEEFLSGLYRQKQEMKKQSDYDVIGIGSGLSFLFCFQAFFFCCIFFFLSFCCLHFS